MSAESTPSDPYEVVLADLRARKAQIEQAISAIESLRGIAPSMGISASNGVSSTPPNFDVDSPGAFLGMSISDAAKKLLAAKRQPMRNPEIAAAFKRGGLVLNSKDVVNTIGAVLARRANEVGDLVKVDRGTWGLKEWYPGRNFKAKSGAAEVRDSDKGAEPQNDDDDDMPSFIEPKATVASVPFMITQAMRDKLREYGATDEDIKHMTPAEAQSYIDSFR